MVAPPPPPAPPDRHQRQVSAPGEGLHRPDQKATPQRRFATRGATRVLKLLKATLQAEGPAGTLLQPPASASLKDTKAPGASATQRLPAGTRSFLEKKALFPDGSDVMRDPKNLQTIRTRLQKCHFK